MCLCMQQHMLCHVQHIKNTKKYNGEDMSTPALLLIDWQEKLFPAMPEIIREKYAQNAETLLFFFEEQQWSLLVSEQYPQGLGGTIPILSRVQPQAISKMHFSALQEPVFFEKLEALQPTQLVITGMETHICVLQTVLDCVRRYQEDSAIEIVVISDAVLSRSKENWKAGLAYMEKAGATIMTTEMWLFTQLHSAKHPLFKAISKKIR